MRNREAIFKFASAENGFEADGDNLKYSEEEKDTVDEIKYHLENIMKGYYHQLKT